MDTSTAWTALRRIATGKRVDWPDQLTRFVWYSTQTNEGDKGARAILACGVRRPVLLLEIQLGLKQAGWLVVDGETGRSGSIDFLVRAPEASA